MQRPNKLISVEEAENLSREEIYDLHRAHTNPILVDLLQQVGFDKKVTSAHGVVLNYDDGTEALDFLGGYGAVPFGHDEIPIFLQTHQNCMSAALAYNLAMITPGKINKFFFCNSGTEANEGAIKIARATSERYKILSTEGGFHGKTLGSLSASGKEKYKKPFEPLVPGFDIIPYNDPASLEDMLKTKEYAAFIVEPIQGEAGVIVPEPGYLKHAQEICNTTGTLLILDEVQTGFGRTGVMFAAEHDCVEPDIITLGKALGGGRTVIGATGYTNNVFGKAYGSKERFLLHTTTFGGNYLSCKIAIESLNKLINENLATEAAEKGEYMLKQLKLVEQKHDLIKEVRGKGLLVGIEFEKPAKSGIKNIALGGIEKLSSGMINREDISSMVAGVMLREHGIHVAYTLNNPYVIRFEPPLTVTKKQIDKAIGALDQTLTEYPSFFNLFTATTNYFVGRKIGKA